MLFAMWFPYKHCNFWPLCLPIKPAFKTVLRPIHHTGFSIRTHTKPDLSNRTKPNKKPIELQSFDWVWQSNKIEHLFCCEFDFQTNQTNIIEQNRTNPMQLSLDTSNWIKHVEYNHCQLLLNNQELNIILQECQCSNKTKQLKGNFDDG